MALLASAILSTAAADEVHLSNGRILDASGIEKTDRVWTLTTDFGRISVSATDVVKVVPQAQPASDPPARTVPRMGARNAPVTRAASRSADGRIGSARSATHRCSPPPRPEFGATAHSGPGADEEIARSQDTAARLALVRRLADSADPEGVPILLDLADDPIVVVRQAAAEALGVHDAAEALAGLLRLASADDPFLAEPSLRGIGRWYERNRNREDFSLASLIRSLDPEPAGRLLFACAAVDRAGTRELVRTFLDSGRPPLRAAAVRAMRWHLDRGLKPLLPALLVDAEPSVRQEAAIACALLKYKDGMPRLVELLGDAQPDVAAAAHGALKLLSGVPLPADPEAWRALLQHRAAR